MSSRHAWTLIETMIVVVIVGLLVAMAIPAFYKVRDNAIVKTVQGGGWETLSESQRARYRVLKASGEVARLTDTRATTQVVETPAYPPADMPAITSPLQTIVVGDKRYVLVPKITAQETTIDGKVFWLVPIAQ